MLGLVFVWCFEGGFKGGVFDAGEAVYLCNLALELWSRNVLFLYYWILLRVGRYCLPTFHENIVDLGDFVTEKRF